MNDAFACEPAFHLRAHQFQIPALRNSTNSTSNFVNCYRRAASGPRFGGTQPFGAHSIQIIGSSFLLSLIQSSHREGSGRFCRRRYTRSCRRRLAGLRSRCRGRL